jgi:cyclophilin family peptidyl-prolyl cis-trans isomerase
MKKTPVILSILAAALALSACSSPDNQKTPVSSDTGAQTASLTDSLPVSDNQKTPTTVEYTDRTIKGQQDLLATNKTATLKTSAGDIEVKLYNDTPLSANNFLNLANAGFYNGTKFHRIIKDFMIQGGDPLTKAGDASVYGTGGPGYEFKNETSSHKLVVGSLAMANAGPDTNGSQFFIVTATSTPSLDGNYTNFGEVVKGMDVVRKIENSPVTASDQGELSVPVNYTTINSITLNK